MDKSAIKLAFVTEQIDALENQTSIRGDDMKSAEAEVLYNHITPLFNRLVIIQNEIENNCNDLSTLEKHLSTLQETQLKAIFLQAKLKTIFTQNQSQPSHVEISSNQPSPKLDTLLKIQTFLIKQIKSIRVIKNVSAAETQYNQISQLYKRFVQNQIQIESELRIPILDIQLEKSQEIQQEVMLVQTKLKEIISSHQSTPPATQSSLVTQEIKSSTLSDSQCSLSVSSSEANCESQEEQNDSMKTSYDTTILIYYQEALIKEIDLVISKKDQVIGPKEARKLLGELSYAYKKFICNNEKIQELMTDDDLENQRQISCNVSIKMYHLKLHLTRKIHTNIDSWSTFNSSVSECQFNFN